MAKTYQEAAQLAKAPVFVLQKYACPKCGLDLLSKYRGLCAEPEPCIPEQILPFHYLMRRRGPKE